MALPLDLAIVAEALFSGIESPVGFAGPDAPPPGWGGPSRSTVDSFDVARQLYGTPAEMQGGMTPQAPEPQTYATMERRTDPTAGLPPMPTLPEAPSDFPLLRRAQRENWQMAMKLAEQYNKYAEKEAAQRRGERTQIRQRLFGALRQASRDYAAARDSLGQTLASQTERGLSPLDLGAPAGRS